MTPDALEAIRLADDTSYGVNASAWSRNLLARPEIGSMFNTIADAMFEITPVADPVRLRSEWINRLENWQVRYE